jgi:hypothetical protein
LVVLHWTEATLARTDFIGGTGTDCQYRQDSIIANFLIRKSSHLATSVGFLGLVITAELSHSRDIDMSGHHHILNIFLFLILSWI